MKKIYILVGLVVIVSGVAGAYWKFAGKQNVLGKTVSVQQTPTPQAQTSVVEASAPAVQLTHTPMKSKQYSNPPPMTISVNKTYVATFTTDKGSMRLTLFAKDAPQAVNNFVFLAREGFYSGTIFHRVISSFMIQGGDPLGNGTGGPGYKFNDEPIVRDYTRGILAMANSGPNTNGSQFFIMHATYPLPKNYVIFGGIDASDSASLATLDKIASSPVTENEMGERSKPITPSVIQSISIEEE